VENRGMVTSSSPSVGVTRLEWLVKKTSAERTGRLTLPPPRGGGRRGCQSRSG
jgi:hypothetical protein